MRVSRAIALLVRHGGSPSLEFRAGEQDGQCIVAVAGGGKAAARFRRQGGPEETVARAGTFFVQFGRNAWLTN